jgi:acyl dehydratase
MTILTENQRYFEDVRVGNELTPLTRGPITSSHLMRWSAAIENWHRVHYDAPFAQEHEQLPDLLVNGTWKQHFLVQMVRRWLGDEGWLASIDFSFRKMDRRGDLLTATGLVTDVYTRDGLGFVAADIGIWNPREENSTPGTALGVLPLRAGSAVPYPFPDADHARTQATSP